MRPGNHALLVRNYVVRDLVDIRRRAYAVQDVRRPGKCDCVAKLIVEDESIRIRMIVRVSIALAIACAFASWPTPSSAQEIAKKCARAEVRSITVSTETGSDWPLDTKAQTEVASDAPAAQEPGQRILTVVAYGPILGAAMNSPEVKTDLACTARGFSLVATITHLGDGDASKNALWRSKISLNLTRHEDATFEMIWKMQRPGGADVGHAQTQPYPEQRYPITVTKTLRFGSERK